MREDGKSRRIAIGVAAEHGKFSRALRHDLPGGSAAIAPVDPRGKIRRLRLGRRIRESGEHAAIQSRAGILQRHPGGAKRGARRDHDGLPAGPHRGPERAVHGRVDRINAGLQKSVRPFHHERARRRLGRRDLDFRRGPGTGLGRRPIAPLHFRREIRRLAAGIAVAEFREHHVRERHRDRSFDRHRLARHRAVAVADLRDLETIRVKRRERIARSR